MVFAAFFLESPFNLFHENEGARNKVLKSPKINIKR